MDDDLSCCSGEDCDFSGKDNDGTCPRRQEEEENEEGDADDGENGEPTDEEL